MTEADVVVIGAGFAGLAAATALEAAGLRVVLFEAKAGVGGRVEARVNGLGERVDLGGQFVCEDMPAVMALARRMGKTLVEPEWEGEVVARPLLAAGLTAEDLWGGSETLRARMDALDPEDRSIDGLTVADWVGSQPEPGDVKAAFLSLVTGLWCVEPGRLPLWFLIGNDRRITNEVTELQYFISETMNSLAEDLAAALRGPVRLGEPVEAVAHDAFRVRVRTAAGEATARAAIVAVPPVAARRIGFQPLPPDAVGGALAAWSPGHAVKLILRYPRPFWRERGLNGIVTWREPRGLFACDTSVDAAKAALTFFVAGPLAEQVHSSGEAAIRALVLERLGEALGEEAGHPLDIALRDWTGDRWSGGAYADLILDRDARDAEAVLRAGFGPIQFACSEISPSYPGYVEGAIIAGREAAQRTLDALAGTPSSQPAVDSGGVEASGR